MEFGSWLGYRIPEDSLPISLENVHTDYGSEESQVIFSLSNGNKLNLIFPQGGGCLLVPEAKGTVVLNSAAFKRSFPITLTVVPVLGPLEHREQRRERNTQGNRIKSRLLSMAYKMSCKQ